MTGKEVTPKSTDSRTQNWDGTQAVELDAIEPSTLSKMCKKAIEKHFDYNLYRELETKESKEKILYKKALKQYVNELSEE
jgi:hypothetical protein